MGAQEPKNDLMQLETEIVRAIKTVFDPEIPVNVYDLGLIYKIDIDEYDNVDLDMTLTAPNCPVADSIIMEVETKVKSVKQINNVVVNLVFDPPWDKDMMSEEAQLELGFM